jgi:hypothetical protein
VHTLERLPIEYILHLARVNGYSFCRDHMTKEWNFTQPELTLAEFCIEVMISQTLKNNAKMTLMLFGNFGID